MNTATALIETPHVGPLDWRVLLRWLRKDGLIF